MTMLLSIVVPVYNVEPYVEECIKSCLDQDLNDDEYEILIVDDGSTDSSVQIANEYAKSHSNIKIISRKNGGLSAARNTGLMQAKGDFVWFVDSDDWIKTNCLRELMGVCVNQNLDVLCFGVNYYHTPKHIDCSGLPTDSVNKLFSGRDFVSNVEMIPAVWVAIYRRDYLMSNELKFKEGILHEDHEFTPRAYFFAQRIMYIHSHVYYYRQRQGSIMKSNRDEKRAIDFLKIADSLFDFAQANTQTGSDEYHYFIQKINFLVCQSLSFNRNGVPPYGSYKNKKYYPLCISGSKDKLKQKIKYILINLSPRLYTMFYRSNH